jgi:hypothetical protein
MVVALALARCESESNSRSPDSGDWFSLRDPGGELPVHPTSVLLNDHCAFADPHLASPAVRPGSSNTKSHDDVVARDSFAPEREGSAKTLVAFYFYLFLTGYGGR